MLKSDKFDDKFMVAWEARSKKMWVNYYYGDSRGWLGWNNIYTAASPQPYIPLANDQSIPVSIRSQTVSSDDTDYMLAWLSTSDGTARELRPIKRDDVRKMISAIGCALTDGQWGLTSPTGNQEAYLRTTKNGLLPYERGNAGGGHSNIGDPSWYFARAYIDQIWGSTFTGNSATATKATQDGNGKTIASTYLPLSGGTVTGPMVFNNGDVDIATGARLCLYSNVPILFGSTSTGATISNLGYTTCIGFKLISSGDILYWSKSSGSDQAFLGPNWTSAGIGTSNLGHSNYKWKNIYASNATIQTSDERLKTNINEFDDEFVFSFIMGIRAVSYKRKDGDRIHYGMIAQDILRLLHNLGLTSMDFAGFIKSPCEKGPNGEEPQYEYIYSLRYEEFIAPIIKFCQMLQNQVDDLKKEEKRQQSEINTLQSENQELKERLARIEAVLGISS